MKNYQKTLIGILAAVVILIGGVQIYVSFFLDQQLKEMAAEHFHTATDNAYTLKIDAFDYQLYGSQLLISDVELAKKEDRKATDLYLALDELNISGISLFDLLFGDGIDFKQIDLIHPQIYLTAEGKNPSSKQKQWNTLSEQLSKTVLKTVGHISISDLSITGLSITYNRADLPVDPYFSVSNSDITFSGIRIDSTSLSGHQGIPADNMTATLRDIKIYTPNELYEITTGSLTFSMDSSTITMHEVALKPRFDKRKFSQKVGHEIDRMDLTIKEIVYDDVDINRLYKNEGLSAGLVTINEANFDIYRDKRAPEAPDTYKPLPQEMIRNLSLPLELDTIRINKGNIRYTEQKPNAEQAGYIEFANLSATLTNLSTVEEHWDNGNIPTLHATTDVMNQAQLDAEFTFTMTDEHRQVIKGSMQPMDMQPLNKALEPIAFVRIDEGRIIGLDFEIHLTEKRAGGTLTLQYEDLKISLLDEDHSDESFGHKAKSFLANTFKIKSDNKGEELRVSKVEFERIEDKSVFNFWWKSLLSGLKESIGL